MVIKLCPMSKQRSFVVAAKTELQYVQMCSILCPVRTVYLDERLARFAAFGKHGLKCVTVHLEMAVPWAF